MESNGTVYIGVDLHKSALNVAVMTERGEVVETRSFATKCRGKIADYFAAYGSRAVVAVESVGFYQWFWDLVQPRVGQLVLADPVGVRAAAGRRTKTDKNDAHLIADLLRSNRLPCSYVPPPKLRRLRQALRLRHSLARDLAMYKHRLRWIGLQANLPGPRALTSASAQKWLRAQKNTLSPVGRAAGEVFQDHIVRLEREIDEIERRVADYLDRCPELAGRIELMQSIPGVGWLTAATILAETGDPARFDHADQISAYAGLAPRVSQSGQSVKHGHISKKGPPILRWILQQSAWVAIRSDEHIRRKYAKLCKRAGNKKAATAIARKLLLYARAVCRSGEPFHHPGEAAAATFTANNGAWCYQI